MVRIALVSLVALGAAIAPSAATEAGDLLVRARAIAVVPTEEASDILPGFPGSSVEVNNAFTAELDFTYFVTDNVAAELILATTKHEIDATGGLSGLGTVAETWVLPPTVTLQYHFMPGERFRPYAGIGLNYTMFYSEDASTSLEDAVGPTNVELDPSFGVALQAGIDIDLNETWFANADVKFIQIDTEATLTSGTAVNLVEVDLDPFVVGVGIGRRF